MPLQAEVRLYERLFTVENPARKKDDFKDYINPDSLQIITNAYIEPSLSKAEVGENYQFIRKGYFCVDKDSKPGAMVFNRPLL